MYFIAIQQRHKLCTSYVYPQNCGRNVTGFAKLIRDNNLPKVVFHSLSRPHIIDEDRCKNAQKLQDAFYGKPDNIPSGQSVMDDRSKQLLELINQSLELAELLIKTLSSKQEKTSAKP